MSVVRLEFPELRSCDKLTVVKGSMALLYCPKLQDIATELNIADNPLYEVSFPELTHIGAITLSCPKVSQMSMPLLKEVDEDLNVTLLGLDTEKLGALEKIGGKLSLNCTAEYLKLPAGLKNLKVFVVSKGIERLDI